MAIPDNKKVKKPRKKGGTDYVDNERLYADVCEFKRKTREAIAENKPLPSMPYYIGEAARLISYNVSQNFKYRRYRHNDEMQSEGILFCMKAVSSFDETKYTNVFTYFTTAVQFAFWQKIREEKIQQYVKFKKIDASNVYTNDMDEDSEDVDSGSDSIAYVRSFIKEFEESEERKKKETLARKKEAARIAELEKDEE